MNAFLAFQTKLRTTKKAETSTSGTTTTSDTTTKTGAACHLHGLQDCKSCQDTFGVPDEASDAGWLTHALRFAPEAGTRSRDDPSHYVVLDPRDKAKAIQAQAKEARQRRQEKRPKAFQHDRRT